MPDLRAQLQALIGPEEEWPDEAKALIKHEDDYGLTQPCYWRAALLAVARMVKTLRVQHGDLLRCEGCEKTVGAEDAEDWRMSSDDCDLCPECWAELVSARPTEEPQP